VNEMAPNRRLVAPPCAIPLAPARGAPMGSTLDSDNSVRILRLCRIEGYDQD